jgi:hypothetical protein
VSKYLTLVNIIDKIREEAANSSLRDIYLPDESKGEAINQSRARAFIHLYLKANFGLLDFAEREALITDGRSDGGIDGYYIQRETRTIFFIQSKYRVTETNFESKLISANELLVMDVNRILDGERTNERGTPYNLAILDMQKTISEIDDIGRYKYKIVILANAPDLTPTKLRQLTGGLPTEVFNFERAYSELVFPIISGTYLRAADHQIALDLSKKNAGTKISYEVSTTHHNCEITVLFVPTVEIAQMMHKYKNSILEFNPRSYLEFQGHVVNDAIRNTILNNQSNEFALFNNGITFLSDETNINEKIGQRNKAQLVLKNPQMINGGQTAYTLSRVLEDSADETPFGGKEVLVKIITLTEREDVKATPEQKLELIEKISTASNQQTPVINADKNSNDQDHVIIQKCLFDRYGILYERKRGEFADGLHQGYITTDLIVERNLFFRLYYAVCGDFSKAVQKRLFLNVEHPLKTIEDLETLDSVYYAFLCHRQVLLNLPENERVMRNKSIYTRIFALTKNKPLELENYRSASVVAASQLSKDWAAFYRTALRERVELWKERIDGRTGDPRLTFNRQLWITSGKFAEDASRWFGKVPYEPGDEIARPPRTVDDFI